MDRDITHLALGGGGGIFAGDIHEPEDRSGRMPILTQGGLGSGQGGPAQLPVGMQPIRIAGQDDDPILLAGVIQVMSRGRRALLDRRGAVTAVGRSASPPSPNPWDWDGRWVFEAALSLPVTAVGRGSDNARIN